MSIAPNTSSIKTTSSSYATLCKSEQCSDANLHAERYQDAQLSQLTVTSATESATEYPDNTTAAATTTAPKDHCDYKSTEEVALVFRGPINIYSVAVLNATSVSDSAVVQPERHPEQHALYELT
ncbi:hypothetical protein GN958_ATG12085 [Phytophthora infestans]|uniref:Uncharacterized protein n=1 Tax=Phytophthora infestans TaxID=4787 RepID=A0A8S9UDP3_PHYIN|nr:hypothetical protein GN958_ATG12085 [Phytophthora infestans]